MNFQLFQAITSVDKQRLKVSANGADTDFSGQNLSLVDKTTISYLFLFSNLQSRKGILRYQYIFSRVIQRTLVEMANILISTFSIFMG